MCVRLGATTSFWTVHARGPTLPANATRMRTIGRIVLAASFAALLASCSAPSDTDGALFGFSPQYGASGVPDPSPENAVAEAPVEGEDVAMLADADGASSDAAAALETASQEPAPVEDDTNASAQAQPVEQARADASQNEPAPAEEQPAKRGFLSAFFSPQEASPAPASAAPEQSAPATAQQPAPETEAATEARPIIDLDRTQTAMAMAATQTRPAMIDTASLGNEVLPGVRDNAGLFEISRRNGIDDDSDIDMLEGGGLYQVAYAPGLARLAPNGLLKQHDKVDVACFRPELVAILRAVEHRFGQKVIVTSGYRSPEHNRRVRGARNSQHMACAAADIHVPGVNKMKVAEFVRAMPRRGGVGTYCHTEAIHVDVGPERDWNWRCRRRG